MTPHATYTATRIGDSYSIILSTPPAPGFTAPQETIIGFGLVNGNGHDNTKGFNEACRLVALANIAAALNHAMSKASDVLESNNPSTLL